MKTLTSLAMNSIVTNLANEIITMKYDLDGIETTAEVTKKVSDDTISLISLFGTDISGNISNIRLVNSSGDIVAVDPREYEKPLGKKLFILLKYKIIETEVDGIGILQN